MSRPGGAGRGDAPSQPARSPADRYAAYMRGRQDDGPELAAFRQLYDFEFDEFQVAACRALAAGQGVLLAAPTGSGKTVAGEFAVHLALAQGRKCFYTTPIKALSNQKYGDLVRRYSAARVGLLTGDNSINGDADAVVMTTEVLRNMLYAGSPALAGLSHVVLDEVHYLADRMRGAVWEEVIIHLPESVALTALSATVSNVEEFGAWLESVRGGEHSGEAQGGRPAGGRPGSGTTVIVDELRPVPLWQHMMVGSRLYDLFAGPGTAARPANGQGAATRPQVNPELMRVALRDGWGRPRGGRPRLAAGRAAGGQRPGSRGPGPGRQQGRPAFARPRRPEVITRLDRAGLLPAITFIFSRAGCDAAVQQCMAAGLRLTTEDEADQIAAVAAARTAGIPPADLALLGYDSWLAGLRCGIAAHHAGLLPAFKETVEQLFAGGLIRAVFATETLALGINMPARTVVIERLDKWNGETHSELTAAEYTQLTGRAGRRGIDVEGHAVVLWQPGVDPEAVAGLAGTRTFPLNSSFRPSYNMAVNLVGQIGSERAARLLETSFAQFQADRAVVGIARQARRLRESMAPLAVSCDRGDFAEYAAIRAELTRTERERSGMRSAARRAAATAALRELRRGDIIVIPGGRRAGPAVVLERTTDESAPAPVVLTGQRQVKKLTVADCPDPVAVIDKIPVPGSFSPRSPQHRKDLAATVRNKLAGRDVRPVRQAARANGAGAAAAADAAIAQLRQRLRRHPCHGCQDRETHARQAEKHRRLDLEAAALERRVADRTHVIARTFGRVLGVLRHLRYLDGEQVTADGGRLARLYTELDLLAAECLRRGVWAGLSPAELAGCVSALTFEARRPDSPAGNPVLPAGPARTALGAMTRLWGELDQLEHDYQLSFLREPDPGFARTAQLWAEGRPLHQVLGDDLTPGDFVRAVRQLIDLLDQVAAAAGADPLAGIARQAVAALRRGVVAVAEVG